MNYLLKTEPSTYSYSDLTRDKTTIWDGVSNPVALKNLRAMQPGDNLVIYHTGDEKQSVGTATVVSVDTSDVRNPQVKIKAGKAIARPVTLAEAKAAVTRLEAARLLSSVYLARERLAARKREQQSAVAMIEAGHRPTGDTAKELSTAKRSAAKADSQTSATPGAAGKDRPAAKQLAAEIKAQQSQLDQLLAQYHSLISAAQGIPHPSGR